jgi:PAS domain S-box-containing protein
MRSNRTSKGDKESGPLGRNLSDVVPFVDELPILLYVIGLDGTILSANRRFCELIGKSPAQIIGLKEEDVLSRPATAEHQAMDAGIRRTGEPVDIAEMNVVVGGRRVVLEGRRVPLRDAEGSIVGSVGMASDITARKLAMEALEEEEARYRTIFEEAPIPYMLMDLSGARPLASALGTRMAPGALHEGGAIAEEAAVLRQLADSVHVVAVNRALLEQTGVTGIDGFRGFLRSIATELAPQLFPHSVEALRDSGRYEGLVAVTTITGEGRLLDVLAVVVPGHEADWSMVIASAIDITERDRAEKALIETKDRFRTIFEDSPVALVELDLSDLKRHLDALEQAAPGGLESYLERSPGALEACVVLVRPIAANRAFLELNEVESLDAFKERSVEHLTQNARDAFVQELVAVARGIPRFEVMTPTTTLKGNLRYVRRVLTVSPGHEGDWSRAIMSLDDITENLQATEALKESEKMFRAIFDYSPIALAEIDLSGVKALLDSIWSSEKDDIRHHLLSHPEDLERCMRLVVPLAVNRAFLQLYDVEDLNGIERAQVDYMSHMIKDVFFEDVAILWEGRGRHGFEAHSRSFTGREFIAKRTFSIVPGHEGDWSRVVMSVEDLTQRRWTEDRMEEERRSAELYLDLLAHDITNLNQGIISSMELLGLKLQAHPELRHYTEMSMRQAMWISDLVAKIRRISMLREDGAPPVPTGLVDVLDSAADRVRQEHPERDVTIKIPGTDRTTTVLGDDMLVEAFVSLLDNAVKFDPAPNAVVDVSLAAARDGRTVTVAVEDHGPGVPDAMKGRILHRLGPDGSRTRGTGLGLIVADHIVRRLGGRLWVEDRVQGDPPKGSRFVVELLAAPVAPAPSG